MNNPRLKGETPTKNKMLSQTNPILQRTKLGNRKNNNHFNINKLNFEEGNFSLGLKAELSLPFI